VKGRIPRGWLGLLIAAGFAARAGTPVDAQEIKAPSMLENAAMDDTGLIWATRRWHGELYTFDGARWFRVPMPFGDDRPNRAEPIAMSRFDDGAAACVWRLADGAFAVSRHSGSESKIIYEGLGTFRTERLPVPPFCDSRNRLWLTGSQPEVRWVDGRGNSRLVHDIQASELVDPEKSKAGYNPVMAVEDPRGRVWVWSNAAAKGTPYASLNGILLCDGDTITRQPLKGLEGKMLGAVTRQDSQHMIVSVLGEGLYRVDVDTWEVARIGDPKEKAFFIVQNFFHAGPDLYVLAWGQSGGRLWRLRDRTWECLVTGFALSATTDRAVLEDGKSFLVASAKNVWLLRDPEKPLELGWATGLPEESVKRMFLRPDGSVFFLGERRFFCGKYGVERLPSRVREMALSKGFVRDDEG
jgi:hypothetical protein